MPFIRGRYHINPAVGAALEAAREAEEASAAPDASGHDSSSRPTGSKATETATEHGTRGPIHRIEIDATELVPSHSGYAQRGFVARIHRASGAAGGGASDGDQEFVGASPSAGAASGGGRGQGSCVAAQPPETHVFAHHQDLTDFLRGEFEKDSDR
jgi:hypothetical protein